MAILKGCDISHYQGQANFDTLNALISFVIIKASEGNGYTDPNFSRNQSESRRVGLLRGYYHFARPDLNNTPQAEAEWFLKVVGTPQAGELLILDFEVNYADCVDWCKLFLDHLSSILGGYKPLIYLNLSLVNNNDWTSLINENYGLWLADYDNSINPIQTKWPVLASKQYSDSGSINGIAGKVDLDVFYGDASTFQSYGLKPTPPAPQPPQPAPINDQTEIALGGEFGTLQVGAIRSTLSDNKATIQSQKAQIVILQQQLDDCQSKPTVLPISVPVEPPKTVPETPADSTTATTLLDDFRALLAKLFTK
jgi:GH25 family lysozyme M1 (1,4-beta-N-acetylmuramidase)